MQLRTPAGAAIGDVFTFMSGLYFRGKVAYARAFARPAGCPDNVLVITPGRGLLPADTRVTIADLRAMAEVPVDPGEPRYRRPFEEAVEALARRLAGLDRVVLLGSVASDKYVEPLLEIIGTRLHFPADFVGRGDMSRGGLLLRCAADGTELPCIPVAGASRRGRRPPRLRPRSATGESRSLNQAGNP